MSSTNVDTGEVESDASDGSSSSEDIILEDRQQMSGAVRDEIHRQASRLADTDTIIAVDGKSASSPGHAQLKSDQTVSFAEEGRGEVPVTCVGAYVTETREEGHASFTVGGMRMSDIGTLDQGEGQLKIRTGNSQTLDTDRHAVFIQGDLHLHQTNVKIENSEAVLIGDNPTVSSGVVQEAQKQPTQAQEQLKFMRDLTSKRLKDWTKGMVHTNAVDVLVEQLSKRPSVYVLKGQPGEGKTTVAKLALKKLEDKGQNVYVVTTPSEYFSVKSVKQSVILLNDIFGSLHFHLDNLSLWEKVFDDHIALQEHRETAQLQTKPTILLVSRSSVLDAAAKHLGRFHSIIMNQECTLDLTKDIKYTVEEKMQIWSHYARLHKLDIEERIVRKVCSLSLLYGFPHCCRLFANMYSENQQLQMEMFFRKPLEFLQQELASVFEDDIAGWLLREMLKSAGKYLVDSYSESSHKSFNVKRIICKYEGLFFRKEGPVVTFHHPSIYDTVAFLACEIDPLFVVRNCSVPFLNDRVRLADLAGLEMEQQKIVIIDSIYKQDLMDRMKNEIAEGNLSDVLIHASFHNERFVKEFMETRLVITESQILRDIIHRRDKKTGESFLFLSSKNKSNKILKFICERVKLNQEDQASVLFGICKHRSEASLQYFLKCFPECDLSVRNERRETLLIVAAQNPCDYILRTLIERGVNVQEEVRSLTALHFVCQYGVEKDLSIVEMMVKNAADVGKCALFEEPLRIACAAGQNKIITTLLQMGYDINAVSIFGTPLTAACKRADNTVVTTLLDRGADIDKPDEHGETPLVCACRRGHTTVVNTLLNRDADINKPDGKGKTPLAVACRAGHNNVVTALLERGADKDKPGGWKEAPLIAACRAGINAKVLTLLNRGTDINKPVGGAETPLTAACRAGYDPVVTTLLDRDADINKPDGGGETPLVAACRDGHNTVVTILLDRDADIKKPNEQGETPLTVACWMGHKTVVTNLLNRGADINTPDEFGQTSLVVACRAGHVAVVKTLLDRDADINKPDRIGQTSLVVACRAGHKTVVATLLDRGADINEPDGLRETPLTAACREGHNTVVTTLLDRDADINKPDGMGNAPLFVACRAGQNTVVTTLLDRGADINKTDRWGQTPLVAACRWGYNTVVTTLLDRRADINTPDGRGKTPLDVAREEGYKSVISTLLDRGAEKQSEQTGETCT